MRIVPLKELLQLADAGVWGDEDQRSGISVLRSTNFQADGRIDFSNLSFRKIEEPKRSTKMLCDGDILLEKSGGGPKQPVGRVCLFRGHERAHAFGNFLSRLRPNRAVIEPEYLFYRLWYFHAEGLTSSYQKQTSGIRNLETKRYLDLPIAVPTLSEQTRVVDLLSRAENIVRMRRGAEDEAQEIIPALFVDMFGDPANSALDERNGASREAAQVATLGDTTDIQGGLQVTTKRAGLPLATPYLRVANVHRTHLDLSEIKTIRLTQAELTRTRLNAGDLLVIEGHGNPAEIGRVGIWPGGINPCTHQNHLIRIRCRPESFSPTYVWAYLNSTAGRQKLLRQGKTTSGLNTISVSNVKSVQVPQPPISLQMEFAARVDELKTLQASQALATSRAVQTFQSLLAGVFGA